MFERTRIIDKRKTGGYTIDELADLANECAARKGNLLLICNKKSEALSLYKIVPANTDFRVFHLSTSMCAEHRTDIINEIKRCLDDKVPIKCIATQLVEAGVDFSFACVIRVAAGMDNIVQSAGRCNRNGECGKICPVYIVNIHRERLDRLQDIKQAQDAAESVLESFKHDSAHFGGKLSSIESINEYYKRLYYELPDDKQDYALPKLNTSIFELLSTNAQFSAHSASKNDYTFMQAFRAAGENFKVFDDNTTDVLVPYGRGAAIIADLCSERATYDFEYCKAKLDEAKRFTISLYSYEIKRLSEEGGIREIWNGKILVLMAEFYSPETGFCSEGGHSDFMLS